MKRVIAVLIVGILSMFTVAGIAYAAAPASTRVKTVTSTSQTRYMPLGYSLLQCSGNVNYKVVAASTDTAASTDPVAYGPSTDGLMNPVWVNISTDRYLALRLFNGTTAKCQIISYSTDGQTGSFTTLTVSSTAAVTGATTLGSTLGVAGAVTSGGVISGIFDGGAGVFTTINTSSTANVAGSFTASGDNIIASTKTRGTCTLNAASPSVCTATVNSGAICTCSNTGTSTNGIKCAVSSTTLTITGPNGATDICSYHCMQ